MIQALIPAVSGILDKFIEDKDTKNQLAHDLGTMADKHAQELAAQIEVLKADAKGGWFQASWRPLIGWTMRFIARHNYMVAPIAAGSVGSIPQAECCDDAPAIRYARHRRYAFI